MNRCQKTALTSMELWDERDTQVEELIALAGDHAVVTRSGGVTGSCQKIPKFFVKKFRVNWKNS
jgi:hypothetical protein